ncbi:MAG: ATP-dependent helicase Lhr and Lhr-like helicase [Variibacter sp.]|nr:ATP-dependent helicase Lhr and Lhr-like helicase [Variibacter sp.]
MRRALLVPSSLRRTQARRRRRSVAFGIEDAGRWSLVRRGQTKTEDAVEHVARALLRRYGVVFWRLIEREPSWLPPWRKLLRVYRKLESRGEIRGGRFVAGFSGEQFALPKRSARYARFDVSRTLEAGLRLGRGSTEPCGNSNAWPETSGASGQSHSLSRRSSGRRDSGRAGDVLRRARSSDRMAGGEHHIAWADFAPSLMPDIPSAEPVEAS